MSKKYSEGLIDFILSMTKAEKRNFRLYATRNTSKDDLKFMLLFDYIERTVSYDDDRFLNKHPQIKRVQLSNIKSHLYNLLLVSIRNISVGRFNELEIREKIDFALILQNKGFTVMALKQLEKGFELAQKGGHNILALEITEFAKNIETQYFTRSLVGRVGMLTKRSSSAEVRVSYSVTFSNLFLEIFGLYLKNGYVRDESEYLSAKRFLNARMVHYMPNELGFEEKNNLYSAMVWYHLIVQDFVMSYKYSKLWLDLFDENTILIQTRKDLYLKAFNNHLIALHNLRNYKRFDLAMTRYENERSQHRDNESIAFIYDFYFYSNIVNRFYLEGRFDDGLELVPEILKFIDDNSERLDDHRIMNLYYKIACMYFGAGNNRKTIFYLNHVIQFGSNTLRDDIQSFARILNLIAHFELGNEDLLENQIKSVYRYLIKKEEMRGVQKEIILFLRNMPYTTAGSLRRAFLRLKDSLTILMQDRYEKRAFLYLDIISWLECKLERRTVQEVVRKKFLQEQKTGDKLYFPR